MSANSTKPYLVRAIYEWCSDSELTPYISASIDSGTQIPKEYIKNGEIILNISHKAVQDLAITNDLIQFRARFNGIPKKIQIPINAIKGIFAKEISQGMFFSAEVEKVLESNTSEDSLKKESNQPIPVPKSKLLLHSSKPGLRIVK